MSELLHHNLESVSDTSDGELGIISLENTKEQNNKRKRANLTDVSSSSGAGSPLNVPFGIGFIRKGSFESNDDYSDGSRRSSYSRKPGYETPATAVVSDSEDEIVFTNDITDLDTFSVEYEPPETSDEEKDEDDSDEEPAIIISSDDSDEDPGADGGDEFDNEENSDSEDSWECLECWTMNHPMTTKCYKCWKERSFALQQFVRTVSAPVASNNISIPVIPVIPSLQRCKTDFPCVQIDSVINAEKQSHLSASPSSATESLTFLADKKMQVSLSRSSSSCSSTTQTSCDSGVCVSSCETDTEKTISVSVINNQHEKLDQQEHLDSNAICLGAKKGDSSSAFSTYSNLVIPGATTSLLSSDLPPVAVPSMSSTEKNATEQPLCVICTTAPRNASIIHGRSGHQVCCITCAEKLKAAKKKCPVCRRKIHYVIKNFL
ncbi:protein Mdm4-like isoform X2 [Actinia tenebrosa]|uniref:Protein Mdm4-like isoform X2 n=1 Tax=Actinia tenebrosa TaxID=6105 RepID=A0A6P8IEA7_ACTTE|nr:protein Mdm4-like isoform X2 [Actinia tenebrosa]